ncbi:MAG: LLM class F420-dependent oxidoreductase [Actinomycetota bacterium]|nr:LLM class F420-dependent oxidoreductase [Actinomycetota bacterium]
MSKRDHAQRARLGLTVGLEGASLAQQLDLSAVAVDAGYTDLWTAEVGGADAFSPLAALAASHVTPRLGTAIVPVFTRSAALIAMSAATLQNLSGGRFVLGIGTSSHIIVNNWMGGSFTKPLTRLRETIEVLRAALSGEKVTYEGETFRLRDFRLQIDPVQEVPIYISALGPRACRLGGELADGVIFFLKSPDGVRDGLELVAEGARAAGRDPHDIDCVARVPVAMDEDPETLAYVLRRTVTGYAMVDVYNKSLAQQGFADEAAAIVGAWKAGERDKAAASVSDEMISQLNVVGDADACRAGVERFRSAGVKTPVLFPISVAPDAQERGERVERAIRTLAR